MSNPSLVVVFDSEESWLVSLLIDYPRIRSIKSLESLISDMEADELGIVEVAYGRESSEQVFER
ncbi:hypothetical protein BHYA_0059g00250 [Botrytis hyacinthi]|uniref:Uncharacterized protein n=1 Tax=Botrytis hyacinthi TaxID=278943 RepID=A0A4Z1GVT2_9HELO|nr:hypothetical protein BHYA_0059g00250 [Botrytis hyacinthi]